MYDLFCPLRVREHVLLDLPDHEEPAEHLVQLVRVQRRPAEPDGALGAAGSLWLRVEHVVAVLHVLRAGNISFLI